MAPRWKVLFAFTGVFVAGVVAGGVASFRAAITKTTADQTVKVTTVPTDQFSPDQMKRFTQQLSLTPEQSVKIKPIIDQAGEALTKFRTETLKQTSTIIEDMQDEVAKQLTDEQRVKLAAIKKQQHERMLNRFGPGSNRRGSPGGPVGQDGKPVLGPDGKPLPNPDGSRTDSRRGAANGNQWMPDARNSRSQGSGRPSGALGNSTEEHPEHPPVADPAAAPAPAKP